MENNYLSSYPKLAASVEFHVFDEKTFLVQQTQFKNQLRVGGLIYFILKLADGKRSIEEITKITQQTLDVNVSSSEIYEAIYQEKMKKLGFIESDLVVTQKSGSDYLKLNIILLKEQWIKKISWIFTPLFKPAFFYIMGVSLLIFLGFCFYFNQNVIHPSKIIKPSTLLTIYGFLLVSTFFHEMGHLAACRKFGANHGGIGFGFYLLSPVFFADVSDAWKLRSSQRVIMDLAGIYMELLFATIMMVIFFITKDAFVINLIFFVLFHTIININPLLRYDGYWAISDLLNIPNLRQEANLKLKKSFNWLLRKEETLPIKKGVDVFLVIYSLISWVFLILFLLGVMIGSTSMLIMYPYNIYRYFEHIIVSFPNVSFEWVKTHTIELFLPTMFYYLVWQISKKHLLNWKELFRL